MCAENHVPARRPLRRPLCVLFAAAWLGVLPATAQEGKHIFGWVENVGFADFEFELKAKLDTGAATSSLDARNVRRFKRGKKRYVSFTVIDRKTGEEVNLELNYVRTVRIKRHGMDNQRRPIVFITVCLGTLTREVEVTLTDRSEFLYPVLLGRSFLEGYTIVDPSLTFTNKPQCDALEHD